MPYSRPEGPGTVHFQRLDEVQGLEDQMGVAAAFIPHSTTNSSALGNPTKPTMLVVGVAALSRVGVWCGLRDES